MQQVQDEVNKWETRMNMVSRMLSEKQQRVQQAKTRNTNNRGDTTITCYRCGSPHKQNVCKIKREDVTCAKCNKQGHMTKVCQSKGRKQNQDGKKGKNFACSTPSSNLPQQQEY